MLSKTPSQRFTGFAGFLRSSFAICIAAVCFAGSNVSATVVLSPNIVSGHQIYDNIFGMDFDANAGLLVTALGVFDSGADGVLNTDNPAQPIIIQIWDRDAGVPLATVDFGGGNPIGAGENVGAGRFFFQELANPLLLQAGGHFYLSEDYGAAERFGNVAAGDAVPTAQDGGGLISFAGSGRYSNTHGQMFSGGTPAPVGPLTTTNGTLDDGPAARYTGPNFKFTAVPESSTAGLAILGGIILLIRFKRARSLGGF